MEKSFNGPFGVKHHLIRGDPVSDGSPPWCPLLIEAFSVCVNRWSLVRVRLMTLSFGGSAAIINLMPLENCSLWDASHPFPSVLCGIAIMEMVDDVQPFSVLCKLRRILVGTENESCLAAMLHGTLFNSALTNIVNRE